MKRATVVLLLLLATCQLSSRADSSSCTIGIFVAEKKNVTITVPCVQRGDLIDMVSTYFGRGDKAATERFARVFAEGGEITLKITTAGR